MGVWPALALSTLIMAFPVGLSFLCEHLVRKYTGSVLRNTQYEHQEVELLGDAAAARVICIDGTYQSA